VLCVDEKSQIQALDRTQPLLPMRPGQVERRSHDYTRHGTTSLFAALDIAIGTVIGRCYPKHRSSEFRKFLDQIEANVSTDLDVHLVIDNYATHTTKPIRDWRAKRPRWHVHFTPTGVSWIDQVERFFALSPKNRSGAASTSPPMPCSTTSALSSMPTTPNPDPSAGPSPQTTSSPPSSGSAPEPRKSEELWNQDTRDDTTLRHKPVSSSRPDSASCKICDRTDFAVLCRGNKSLRPCRI
jgi:hypothetical protein